MGPHNSGNGDDVSFVRKQLGSDLGHQHPVLSGFAALAVVTVSIALLLALVTVFGARVLGISGGSGSQGTAPGAGPTLWLPDPKPTEESSDEPGLSLPSGEPSPSDGASVVPPTEPSESESAAPAIELAANPGQVGSFERINLTGAFPQRDGAILQVQRKESGRWVDFNVTTAVRGGNFATYVQTSHTGLNLWRVKDTDSGATSNVVRVTVG